MITRDEILAAVAAGPEATVTLVEAVVGTLLAQNATLSARIKELEDRLDKDSHNSHKPPSSDGLAKKPHPRSLRKKTGKPSGGQPGHPGTTRCWVADPAEIILHAPNRCAACATALTDVPAERIERRQVVELPQLKARVTEHQGLTKVCPLCQARTSGTFPADVTQAVQYGPVLKATGV